MKRLTSWRLGAIAVTLVGVLVPLAAQAGAVKVVTANDNHRTLVVSLPGPFTGCSILSPETSSTNLAVLDLLRPSAFQTEPGGATIGEGGPIASAELTSLSPETVRYTIRPNSVWSNGEPFTGRDLVVWWREARKLSSVVSDGYRAISSMKLTNHALTVTARFARTYSYWTQLFRDVEAPGPVSSCATSRLVHAPSLGPYFVTNASPGRLVLSMNHSWPLNPARFGRVILTSQVAPPSLKIPFAAYSLNLSPSALASLSSDAGITNRFGTSTSLVSLTFSLHHSLTSRVLIRKALSWSLNRQNLINDLWGKVTFNPAVAASAIFAQGENGYPGSAGSGLPGQSTTTTIAPTLSNGLNDCSACAVLALKAAGLRYLHGRWRTTSGSLFRVHLAIGPSAIDHASARLIANTWRRFGISTSLVSAHSELGASLLAVEGHVEVALVTRQTGTAPSMIARSFVPPSYRDSFSIGSSLNSLTKLYAQAMDNFNPVSANASWLALDRIVLHRYWVRPLYTMPSLLAWSNTLASTVGSTSVPGFVDQIPSWSTETGQPPSSFQLFNSG